MLYVFFIFNIAIYYRSEESNSRPKESIEDLIKTALKSLKKKSTSKEIVIWVEDHYKYYKRIPNKGWKKSIKNCLSAKQCFKKIERCINDGPGKESYWILDPKHSNMNGH